MKGALEMAAVTMVRRRWWGRRTPAEGGRVILKLRDVGLYPCHGARAIFTSLRIILRRGN